MVISDPEGLIEKGRCEHKLAGSGGVSQTDSLGKRVADEGKSWSKGPEAGVCQKVQGGARLPGDWSGGDAGVVP